MGDDPAEALSRVPGRAHRWGFGRGDLELRQALAAVAFAALDDPADDCPNALARKQTGAAGLLDCRAYELVSAPRTNGYHAIRDLDVAGHLTGAYLGATTTGDPV